MTATSINARLEITLQMSLFVSAYIGHTLIGIPAHGPVVKRVQYCQNCEGDDGDCGVSDYGDDNDDNDGD